MHTTLAPEIQEVIGALHYRPAVSIILPFEPKMSLKTELARALKSAAGKVEEELKANYPEEICSIVMQKLGAIIQHLNFDTHKKSIAVYVSPVFEKVLYLDIAVEEKIIVGDSFEIRDLVYSKNQLHKYLVLLLSGKECQIYLGNGDHFVKIVSNTPSSAYAVENDVAERVANFSDYPERKEILMEKFLHQIDNSLDIILHSYQLPLFVLGTKRISGHFSKITRHARAIIEYIPGNYEEATPDQLMKKLEPHVNDWKKVRQKDLLNQLEEALGKKRVALGMKEVWHEAMNQNGRLLVVENNYMYAALQGDRADRIDEAVEPFNKFSYIKDAVDQVIEKVLENGGDVEFVDQGLLQDYHRIALIQYY